jgi:hypothetical protein
MSSDDDARLNHEKFVKSLEKYAYLSPNEVWIEMADELGWDVEEVRSYAFQYLIAMQSLEDSEEDTIGPEPNDEWTLDEIILLEALLVQHSSEIKVKSDSLNCTPWEEKIAAQIPGKTAQQVRAMFESEYSELQNCRINR